VLAEVEASADEKAQDIGALAKELNVQVENLKKEGKWLEQENENKRMEWMWLDQVPVAWPVVSTSIVIETAGD
jgi:hypothetical protein